MKVYIKLLGDDRTTSISSVLVALACRYSLVWKEGFQCEQTHIYKSRCQAFAIRMDFLTDNN